MQSELAEARSTIEGLKQREMIAKARVEELQIALEGSQSLVVRLEADLESQLSLAASGGPAVKRGISDPRSKAAVSLRADSELEQLLAPTEFMDNFGSEIGTSSSKNASNDQNTTQGNQMASILQAQRDRYKERLDQVTGWHYDISIV